MKKLTVHVITYLQNFRNYFSGIDTKARVHQLEAELAAAKERLEQQSIELKRSNDDLEQLSYVVSHDLKAPVRNIGSFMKLLLSKYGNSFTGDAREFMEHSRESAERLAQQIDDLVCYCKIGRGLPPATSVDMEQMIKTIQSELSVKIKERNTHIIIEQSLPVLQQVHSGMIHLLFQNLIDNALKFNTSENSEVRIGCKEEDGVFTFSVGDNGVGIAPEYKSKLFQLFKRLHSADQFEGTGIGLALCKKIVNFYHGTIRFDSEHGKGTTFYFTIPIAMDISVHKELAYPTPVLKAA